MPTKYRSGKCRQRRQKPPFLLGSYIVAAKSVGAIGNHEVSGRDHHIVPDHLLHGMFTEGHIHFLALHQHPGLRRAVVDHDIVPLLQFSQEYFLFNTNQGSRVSHYFYEVIQEILSYPFLRREHHILFTVAVKDQLFTAFSGNLKIRWGEADRNQSAIDFNTVAKIV